MRGHIRRRGAGYSVVIDVGQDPLTLKRRQKWYSGLKTKRAAEKKLTELLGQMDEGSYISSSKQTLAQYLATWLASIKPPAVSPSTWSGHRTFVKCHIIPALGDIPLERLSASHLDKFYGDLLDHGRRDGKGGLSPRSVSLAHATLHTALATAVRSKLLARNVVKEASPPRAQRLSPRPTWSVEELTKFLEHVAGDRLFAAYHLAAFTGLRRGELLGLRWRDLDLEANTLSSVHTVISVDYAVLSSTPKTAAGRRSVVFDARTAEVMKRHRLNQNEERVSVELGPALADDLVFSGPDGSPIHPNGFSDRFDRLVRAVNIPRLTVHGLRHTHATLMLKANVHPRVVQERLGHANIAVTLQTYSHVLPGMQAAAADKFAQMFS